jgi:hypothetical protein
MAMSPSLNRTCLACDRQATIRGLCSRCYQGARNAIAARETTEEELIRKRLLLPRYANIKRSAFMNALLGSKLGNGKKVIEREAAPSIIETQSKVDPWTLALWDMT